jgi:hypothetical protein
MLRYQSEATGYFQEQKRRSYPKIRTDFSSPAYVLLRPELQALFDRLAINPRSELFVRDDGMVQAGPDPASETGLTKMVPHKKNA